MLGVAVAESTRQKSHCNAKWKDVKPGVWEAQGPPQTAGGQEQHRRDGLAVPRTRKGEGGPRIAAQGRDGNQNRATRLENSRAHYGRLRRKAGCGHKRLAQPPTSQMGTQTTEGR